MSSSEAILQHEQAQSADEPSLADKAAFVKAMYRGIAPDTDAARSVARKLESEDAPKDAPRAEVVRRIPASAPAVEAPPGDAISAAALALAAEIEAALAEGEPGRIAPEAQQALIAALCRLYAANDEAGNRFEVVGPRAAVTATDVMIMCGALLRAVDLQVFELGVWQSWTSR